MDSQRNVTMDWSQFMQAAQSNNSPSSYSSHAQDTHHKARWSGTDTYSQAVNLAITGWIDGAETAKRFSSVLFERISTLIERQVIVYDVEGSGLDVSRYLDGEPECFQRWESELAEMPSTSIVRITLNGSASSGITAETITAKGASIAALVELLEFSGKRVELTVVFSTIIGRNQKASEPGITSDTLSILVKPADQPLDAPRIAYVLAHASMFRRLIFGFFESGPVYAIDSLGYGHCAADSQPADCDIYVPRSQYPEVQWSNPQAATQYVLDQLSNQGVNLHSEENQ